jgi:uncharacterized membrane protein YphA (DoxX/SURF4 family)
MREYFKARKLEGVLSIFFGLLFLLSGITKITALDAFLETLTQLDILPPIFRGFVLFFLPGLEVAIAFCFLFRIHVHDAAIIASALLVCFTVITIYQYIQNPHGSCGCVHIPLLKRMNDPLIAIFRNCGLLLLSIILFKFSQKKLLD